MGYALDDPYLGCSSKNLPRSRVYELTRITDSLLKMPSSRRVYGLILNSLRLSLFRRRVLLRRCICDMLG
jgi:hypothetical protein